MKKNWVKKISEYDDSGKRLSFIEQRYLTRGGAVRSVMKDMEAYIEGDYKIDLNFRYERIWLSSDKHDEKIVWIQLIKEKDTSR